MPVLEKLIRYAPIADVEGCENCATIFIIAENEELFENKGHAILTYERATGIKKRDTVKGIKTLDGIGCPRTSRDTSRFALNPVLKHLNRGTSSSCLSLHGGQQKVSV